MNNYEISFTQNLPDRNGMYISDVMYFMSVNKIMQNSLPDEFKKLNIEIEEVNEN